MSVWVWLLGGCTHFDRLVAADSATTAYALAYALQLRNGQDLPARCASGGCFGSPHSICNNPHIQEH